MIDRLRVWLRVWLAVPTASQRYEDWQYERALKSCESVQRDLSDLNARFDALADTLGIVVVVDTEAPIGARIESIRADGLAATARDYIEAVAFVATIVHRQQRLLQSYAREVTAAMGPLIVNQPQPRGRKLPT